MNVISVKRHNRKQCTAFGQDKEPAWRSIVVTSEGINSLKANLLHCKNSDFSNLGASPEV